MLFARCKSDGREIGFLRGLNLLDNEALDEVTNWAKRENPLEEISFGTLNFYWAEKEDA